MLCPECRKCQLVDHVRTIQHAASGHPDVRLQNVIVGECPECQAEVVSLNCPEELDRLVTAKVAVAAHRPLVFAWQEGRWVEI